MYRSLLSSPQAFVRRCILYLYLYLFLYVTFPHIFAHI